MKSRQEVRDFLNSQVGLRVNAKAGIYNGQCVSLIKALLEFLGVPDPYAARGDAKDCGDTLLRQGIAKKGAGWLNVCVNRDMGLINGVRYGHIWLDVANEMNVEQNGNKALLTTKNTRPVSQAQQIINLDQWMEGEMTEELARAIAKWGRLLGFNSVEKMNANSANDVKQIMANPMYAAALLEQLYKGEWQVPAWKANNFEANGKTKYNEGYVAGQKASGGDLPVGTYLKIDKADVIEVKETK